MYRNVFLLFAALLLLFGCKNDNIGKKLNLSSQDSSFNSDEAFQKAKEIIYMLPNPSETAMALKNANPSFSKEFLVPINYVEKFNTEEEEALALGVYSADLSLLTMFEQNQEAVEYVSAVKKLADNLGILEVINDSVITEVQENLQNKDKVVNIVSNVYLQMKNNLEETNRDVLAAMVVTGAWVEGLYLTVNMVNDVSKDTSLVEIVSDQRYSLEDLIELLDVYKNDEKINKINTELKELLKTYEKSATNANGTKTLSSDDFDTIKTKIAFIRKSFVNEP